MNIAVALRDRLPRVREVFLAGKLSARLVAVIAERTRLVIDPDANAELDARIAEAAVRWGPMTKYKLSAAIDLWVQRVDPAAVIRAKEHTRTRDFTIGDPNDESGTTSVWGRLLTTDAALLAERLAAMTAGVCQQDPRTHGQRRADAIGALAAGSTALACQCGSAECATNSVDDGRAGSIIMHVVADDTAALIPGMSNGTIPAAQLRDVIGGGAKIKPLAVPQSAQDRYRPSATLDRFIRLRDLTCRHPGCDRPAMHADVDHTVPYPAGPTHPANLKAYCRHHHLLKTFWPGWSDEQLPDGTVRITTPTGHIYTTKPLGALLFSQLAVAPGPVPPKGVPTAGAADRARMMPTRRHTRAQARARRITAERAQNLPPPF